MYTIDIPVHAKTKKVIEKKFGSPSNFVKEPLIKFHLKNILRGKRRKPIFINHPYESSIQIEISEYNSKISRACLDETKLVYFNFILENYIRSIMFSRIHGIISTGISQRRAIYETLKYYDLPETICKYESIKKDFDRKKSIL